MFEKYTEKARRVMFFARYEASQMGSKRIEAEHVLLGLIREDKDLARRFFPHEESALESVRKQIKERATTRDKISTSIELPLSDEVKRVLAYASEEAERLLSSYIGTAHILLGLLREENSFSTKLLYEQGIRLSRVREELTNPVLEHTATEKSKDSLILTEFSRDLTEAAINDLLDPLIGRDAEIERAIQILSRRTKNNPVLIGEPGVGKTAIVEGLAQKIVRGEVPPMLRDKRIVALDISSIVAGTKYRGQFEERLKAIMKELVENSNFIIFVDEMHTLVGAGSAEGSLDAANILKPALSRGEIQCIGATASYEYRRFIEKDRALERRFQSIKVAPTTEEETLRIIHGIKGRYEAFHQVKYTEGSIHAAVFQSSRYITDRYLPDKAIDVLDEAGARVKLDVTGIPEEVKDLQKEVKFTVQQMNDAISMKEFDRAARLKDQELDKRKELQAAKKRWQVGNKTSSEVTKEHVEHIISRWTGIPVSSLREEEMQKLLHMEKEIHKRVISQECAVSAVARAIRRSRVGMKDPDRPVGSFLFLGPTGVGKTELTKSLAEFLFGSEKALLRFDMSEYMEKHAVSKLIGAPPGYIGHEEGGQLTKKVKQNPYSVLLLDEIEKAHIDIWNLLLQVFEDGLLTDSSGNCIDFKNVIIIMTSNIGARHLVNQSQVGFSTTPEQEHQASRNLIMAEVKKVFNPEFVNRLDEIIIFDSLNEKDLCEIVDLLLNHVNKNLESRKIRIQLQTGVQDWIVQKTCLDRSYGARPLRRAIQRHIEDPVSDLIIQGKLKENKVLGVYLKGGELYYRTKGSKRTGIPLSFGIV